VASSFFFFLPTRVACLSAVRSSGLHAACTGHPSTLRRQDDVRDAFCSPPTSDQCSGFVVHRLRELISMQFSTQSSNAPPTKRAHTKKCDQRTPPRWGCWPRAPCNRLVIMASVVSSVASCFAIPQRAPLPPSPRGHQDSIVTCCVSHSCYIMHSHRHPNQLAPYASRRAHANAASCARTRGHPHPRKHTHACTPPIHSPSPACTRTPHARKISKFSVRIHTRIHFHKSALGAAGVCIDCFDTSNAHT
jgi:hypothetical protein